MGGSFAEAAPDMTGAMTTFRVNRGLSYRDLGSQLPPDAFERLKGTVQENITYGEA